MPLDLMHREVLDTVRAHQGRFLTYSAVWDQDFTALFEQIDAPLLLMCAEKDVLWPFFERACDMRTDAQSVTVGGRTSNLIRTLPALPRPSSLS